MNNREIASTLNMIGTLLEILDDNSFRANAYYTVSRRIEGIEKDLAVEDLAGIAGVGAALRDKLTDMISKGTSPYLDSLRAEIPPGLLEILRIPNLGPKRVKSLWRELGVTNLQELEKACAEDRLKTLKGFGQKLQEKVARGLQWLKQYSQTYLLGESVPAFRDLQRELQTKFHVKRFELVGSTRRGCELVRNLDVLASLEDPNGLANFLKERQLAQQVEITKDSLLSAKLTAGLPLRIYTAPAQSFGAAMVYLTGSRFHVDRLRLRANGRGLELTERGLLKGDDLVEAPTETDLYARLDLPFIDPELREDSGEIEAAEKGRLPVLVTRADLAGTVHAHSTWSDGINKLEEMVSQAVSLGFKFIGMSDHSRSASYAGGLTVDRLNEQSREIAQIQVKYPQIRILQGSECDILADGSMDYPDEVLRKLDFVIASIHSQFQMSEEQMTARVIKALENPYVDILGHPTGRLLLGREGFKINLDRVLDAAKKLDKVVELNANPHRLDLDTRWARAARDKGVRLSIDPDAHNRLALTDVDYGVTIARRAWVSRETILNAGDPSRALDHFKRNR